MDVFTAIPQKLPHVRAEYWMNRQHPGHFPDSGFGQVVLAIAGDEVP